MDIFKIAAVGLIGAILALVLKKDNPLFAVMLSIMVSILIFMMILPQLTAVIELMKNISSYIGPGAEYIMVVVKIIGISYAAEFGAQICADAGENSIASKIELGGKVLIMGVSAPVVLTLLEQVVYMIPS